MTIHFQHRDAAGDRLMVVAEIGDMPLEAVRAEARRWRTIYADRGQATNEDNDALRLVAEKGVVPRHNYERAAHEIRRAWESAVQFLEDAPWEDEDED
jgi:hypothetical protein